MPADANRRGAQPKPDHSKPGAAPRHATINREEIRELAAARLATAGPQSAREIAAAVGADAALVAIALGSDARFARSMVEGVLQWSLASARAARAAAKPAAPTILATAVRVPLANAPTLVIEEVNGARAAELLTLSRGNRKLRSQHVEWLARQILEGCWRLTHQAIAISASNRLLDGHHRLHAIVRAKQPVLLAMSYGWADDVWDALDCGVVRLAQDRLALIPESTTWNQRAIEMIHSILRLEQGHRGKSTNGQIATAWLAYRSGVELVRTLFPTAIYRLTRTPMMGALVRYHQQEPARAAEFGRDLLLEEPKTSQAALLRAWLLSGEFVGCGQRGNREVYWRAVAAMRAHRDGEQLAKLEMATGWT
jgi:hypothetical protein